MKYIIRIKAGGYWRNFITGEVVEFVSRRVAEQVISNWMIAGDVVDEPLERLPVARVGRSIVLMGE